MADIYIRSTGFVLGVLEDIFKDKVTISGAENIPVGSPIMFAANHFTRAETLLLPYFVHKQVNKMARSLADKNLFKGGALTEFLQRTGTLSTEHPERDNIIISDLLSAESDWIIYPEGNMMKNKKVTFSKGKFYLHLKDKVRALYTGSATLAIKSQLIREEYLRGNKNFADGKYFDGKTISPLSTVIVPINISYYPIRPGANKMKFWVEKFAKKLSPRMAEEIEIEGNILADANMNVHFCKPIYLNEFLSTSKFITDKIPLISAEKKHDIIINYQRHKLTTAVMKSVYKHAAINLDHIFALTLYFCEKDEIHIKELISRVYLNIKDVEKLDGLHMHDSLKVNIFKVLSGKHYEPLNSIFELARTEGILIGDEQCEYLKINRSAFDNEYEFHNIRLKNVMKILINEMMLLDEVTAVAKQNARKPNKQISAEIFDILLQRDIENFNKDYEKNKSELSKPREFGKPFFLKGKDNKLGVVLSHGYKSSPEEVRPLAEYLNNLGYNVYCVRLHGHGTAPENIKSTTWQKWYDSYMRGVVALDQICEKVVFAGFSTGGLLSLHAATLNREICGGVVSINAAIKLQDIRVRLVKIVNFWNELSDKFRGHGVKEYIDDEPENPHINYSRNYLKGVHELGKLMREVKENLAKVLSPTLIIQAKNDPIVKPESGNVIFDEIHSKEKILIEPDYKNHVIILGENREKTFKQIAEFIAAQ